MFNLKEKVIPYAFIFKRKVNAKLCIARKLHATYWMIMQRKIQSLRVIGFGVAQN